MFYEEVMSSIAPENSNNKSNKDDVDQYIYDAIVDAIMNRQLSSGMRLTEAPLCKAFGVTRGVLRRVFVKLAHDRVIEIQPNRGAIVAQHSFDETRDIFEARSMLEVGTVRKLVQKEICPDFSKLKNLVHKEAEVRNTGQWKEWIKMSGEFHIHLSEVNKNQIVTSYLQTLIARTSLLIQMYDHTNHNECAVEEHMAILNAIELGDEKLAVRLMEKHLSDYANVFLKEKPKALSTDLTKIFQNKKIYD